jgi:hypothetical protein
MPISRYIGASSSSQNRKNRNRSSDANTPATAVSRTSTSAKYSFGRTARFHDTSTARKVSSAFSTTSGRLIPSTPTW